MVIEFPQAPKRINPPETTEYVALMRDGNQICALIGKDLQSGIGGFGATAAKALRDLADQMEAGSYPLPGIDF